MLTSNETAAVKAYESRANTAAAHPKLFEKLTDYNFTGGIVERSAAVSKIHQDLVQG